MKVKIDTREKFHVITIHERELAANMTADLENCLLSFLQSDVKNVIVNLKDIEVVETAAGQALVKVQEHFYDNNASFVICQMQKPVEESLDREQLLEVMNTTPTESEAWDIVQMEEIERELLDGAE